MKTLSLVLAAAAALGSSLYPQEPDSQEPVRPTVRAAWEQFLLEQGPDWTAVWNPATGTPEAIYGAGLQLAPRIDDLATARELGRDLLQKQAALLGVPAAQLVERTAVEVAGTYVLIYDQRCRGLRVVDGRADVRLKPTGGAALFGARGIAVPDDLDTTPLLSREQARAIAARDRGVQPRPGADELLIWADADRRTPTPVRLAWSIDIDEPAAETVGRVFVDARTGAVLEWHDEFHTCFTEVAGAPATARDGGRLARAMATARALRDAEAATAAGAALPANVKGKVVAWVNTGLKPTDALQRIPLRNVQVQVVGGNGGFTDANGDFDIPHAGSAAVTVRVEYRGRRVAAVNPQQGTRFVKTMTVTPGVATTIELSGATASETEEQQGTVYWGTDDVNEYFRSVVVPNPPGMATIDNMVANTSLTRTCNAFYTRNTINFFQTGGGCNKTGYSTVIYHEWGHGIDDVLGGISQVDGLSEGWGDTIAIYRTGQPIVGDGFRTNGGFIRTALNTKTYPPGGFGSGGAPHPKGEVWMGCCWDLRTNLIASLGQTKGVAHAEKIVLSSMVADATNQPGALREVFIMDDDDANLNNGTPNYDALEKAALKRKIPYPQKKAQKPGTWTAFGAGCPGTGKVPAACMTDNLSGSLAGSQGYAGVRYMLELVAPRGLTVEGFQIKLASRASGNVTLPTFLYSANAAGQPDQVLATGSMVVGPAAAMYATTLDRTVAIGTGQRFFIGFQNANPTITVGTLSSGTIVPYWRNNGSGGSWIRFTTRAWAYQVDCRSSTNAVPTLTNVGTPEIPREWALQVDRTAADAGVVLFFGASNSTYNGLKLPLDLTPFGAAGCSLLASGEIAVALRADAAGSATLKFDLPNDGSLVDLPFFNQAIVLDAGANTLGLAFSNGGAGKIGKF